MCHYIGLRIEYLRQWAIFGEKFNAKVKAFTSFFGFVICYSSCLPRLLGHSKEFIRPNKHMIGAHFLVKPILECETTVNEIAKRVNKILIFTTWGDYRTVDRQNNMLPT